LEQSRYTLSILVVSYSSMYPIFSTVDKKCVSNQLFYDKNNHPSLEPNTYNMPSLPPIKSMLSAIHGEESIIFIVGNFHV